MAAIFKIGRMVTVTGKSTIPVAGHGGDHTGRRGKVRGYADLSADDIIHIVDLGHMVDTEGGGQVWEWYDKPFFVPNETPNPPAYGPGGQLPYRIHGVEQLPDQRVDWIEVPASCLS
jgi:hypothetical protein